MKVLIAVLLCLAALFQLPEQASAQPTCEFCQFAVKFIEGYLAENATEEQIVKALNVICLLSPVTFQQECQAFVAQEVPIIIQYLLNKQNPDTICSELNLCSNSSFAIPSSSSCQICVGIVTYCQQLFNTGSSAQYIIDELDSQCDIIAKVWGNSDFASECKGMVAVSASMIAKDINQKPTEICSALGVQC